MFWDEDYFLCDTHEKNPRVVACQSIRSSVRLCVIDHYTGLNCLLYLIIRCALFGWKWCERLKLTHCRPLWLCIVTVTVLTGLTSLQLSVNSCQLNVWLVCHVYCWYDVIVNWWGQWAILRDTDIGPSLSCHWNNVMPLCMVVCRLMSNCNRMSINSIIIFMSEIYEKFQIILNVHEIQQLIFFPNWHISWPLLI